MLNRFPMLANVGKILHKVSGIHLVQEPAPSGVATSIAAATSTTAQRYRDTTTASIGTLCSKQQLYPYPSVNVV